MTVVGFGVPLALAAGDCAGVDEAAGAGLASGARMGLAGAGAFDESSATVSFIASSTGIRTTPLFLSTQARVLSAWMEASWAVWSFLARASARFSS